jgi:hypothetical protein
MLGVYSYVRFAQRLLREALHFVHQRLRLMSSPPTEAVLWVRFAHQRRSDRIPSERGGLWVA